MKDTLLKSSIHTPVGKMIIITSDKGVCFLEYDKQNRRHLLNNRLQTHFAGHRLIAGKNEISNLIPIWINTYFNDSHDPDFQIPLATRGTDFEKKVWQELLNIPFGKTFSYKEIAVKIGNPNSSRAVGGASRRNPVSIIVPCHRVVGSTGSLTGYGGGLDIKLFLLEHESAKN